MIFIILLHFSTHVFFLVPVRKNLGMYISRNIQHTIVRRNRIVRVPVQRIVCQIVWVKCRPRRVSTIIHCPLIDVEFVRKYQIEFSFRIVAEREDGVASSRSFVSPPAYPGPPKDYFLSRPNYLFCSIGRRRFSLWLDRAAITMSLTRRKIWRHTAFPLYAYLLSLALHFILFWSVLSVLYDLVDTFDPVVGKVK